MLDLSRNDAQYDSRLLSKIIDAVRIYYNKQEQMKDAKEEDKDGDKYENKDENKDEDTLVKVTWFYVKQSFPPQIQLF